MVALLQVMKITLTWGVFLVVNCPALLSYDTVCMTSASHTGLDLRVRCRANNRRVVTKLVKTRVKIHGFTFHLLQK